MPEESDDILHRHPLLGVTGEGDLLPEIRRA